MQQLLQNATLITKCFNTPTKQLQNYLQVVYLLVLTFYEVVLVVS